jgi:hypothetical protein
MFSRYYAGRHSAADYEQRYRESPHKARIDHVAEAVGFQKVGTLSA